MRAYRPNGKGIKRPDFTKDSFISEGFDALLAFFIIVLVLARMLHIVKKS